ncbi:MAG: putative ABC transporter permease [Roseburia sp.]
MKKKEHKPDFHKLCCPGQNHTMNFIARLVFYFFLGSLGGFLWEVGIFLVKEGAFRNRGFLYGPWLPVYGAGAVVFYLFFRKIKSHPAAVFLLTALTGTVLELAIGWLLDTVWELRYWDYSGQFLNYKGYICLWSALGFGIAGAVWVCLLAEPLWQLWQRIPRRISGAFLALLVLLFLWDCAAALIFPNMGTGITFSMEMTRFLS